MGEVAELNSELASWQADLPTLESKAAKARLQLGCERSTVVKQVEEISKCRAAVPALMQQLREIAPVDRGSRARQGAIAFLRRELTDAYATLAAAEAKSSLVDISDETSDDSDP